MKNMKGITLISLVITVIILLILAVVLMGSFNSSNVIDDSSTSMETAKIEAKRSEIEMEVVKQLSIHDGDVTFNQIVKHLEEKGLIKER